MNNHAKPRSWLRRLPWDIVLAAIAGVVLFVILVFATGGLILSLVTVTVALLILGLFDYLVWGRIFLKNVADKGADGEHHARYESVEAQPADEIELALSESERVELIRALERVSAEPPGPEAPAPVLVEEKAAIQRLLDRLRGFGA